MLIRLLLLFTVVPFIELIILLKLSEMHGWVLTVTLILVTGVIGTVLARAQGMSAWKQIQSEMRSGRPPTDPLLDGVMILLASALLITPGVLTDAVGFLLLFPPFRLIVRTLIKQRISVRTNFVFTEGQNPFPNGNAGPTQQSPRFDDRGQEIIDVEYTRKS